MLAASSSLFDSCSSLVRDYAEEVGATLLLEKVDEFKRENAFALEEMIDWEGA